MAELREITEAEDARKKEEERKKRLGRVEVSSLPAENFEHAKVDEIVSRMKQRFDARGYGKGGKEQGKGEELKEKVTGKASVALDQRLPGDMAGQRGFAGFAGKMHKAFKFFNSLTNRVSSYSMARKLPQQLDKANMNYSTKQYVGMAVVASVLASGFFLFLSAALLFVVMSASLGELAAKMAVGPIFTALSAQGVSKELAAEGIKYLLILMLAFLTTAVGFIFSLLVGFQMPMNRSLQRGKAIDKELPFALRHMATEIKAGIGIHKTMESIVEADYGELSVEFKRTLREIDKGTSTDDALMAMGERSPSSNLSKALMHMVRTLKTGGNLTVIIQMLASDVAFELRMNMRDFVERLNLVGLFYMMLGIVFPVFIAVLAGIFNAIPTIGLAGMLGTQVLFLIYFILIPMGLGLILYIIKVMQPM